MDIFGIAVLIFLVTDPFGNIAIFLAALKSVAPERRLRVAVRELLFALVLLMAFLTFGDKVLSGLGLSREATAIAGGIILFSYDSLTDPARGRDYLTEVGRSLGLLPSSF